MSHTAVALVVLRAARIGNAHMPHRISHRLRPYLISFPAQRDITLVCIITVLHFLLIILQSLRGELYNETIRQTALPEKGHLSQVPVFLIPIFCVLYYKRLLHSGFEQAATH